MAQLKNTWIGYFDRSYEQAKTAILTRLGVTTPELSDHTESNPLIIILDIFLAVSELLHYYIDNAAREVYLHSARQYKSAQKIAKLFNYRLKCYSAASTIVTFSIENPVIGDIAIPVNTIVKSGDIEYRTQVAATIVSGDTSVDVIAIQRTPVQLTFTSDGNPSQKFELPFNTVDKSLTVTVNSIQYSFVDNFYLSADDSIHFTTEVSADQKIYLVFGDGTNAVAPLLNSNIVVDFYTCVGSEGNVANGTIDTIESALATSENVSVTNGIYATGGSELETLKELKRTIPASIRTLNRAVTELDFRDIAESDNGVSQAFVDYDCGAAVDVYIVPTGTGGATDVLINSVRELFYDETRLIMMEVNIKPAGRLSAIIQADVTVVDVYNQSLVIQAVKDNLREFLSEENQEISGSVYVGDIYQVIENTEGVSHCEISLLSTIPEATIVAGTNVLNWERELFPTSDSPISWSIKYIGSDNYELRKENIFVGTFPIGAIVSLSVIEFKILPGTYQGGDRWEFVTYPYNGTIELNEPSIVTIEEANIDLTATGGV